MVLLAEPRPFSSPEEAIIDFLNSGPLGRNELREQAAHRPRGRNLQLWLPFRMDRGRSDFAGCRLHGSGNPGRPTDHVALTAYQYKTRGSTEVTLHV